MLKAIPGISKKVLVILIAVLFLASIVFFASPGKINGETPYDGIYATVSAALAGQGVASNIGDTPAGGYAHFQGLYFEKSIDGVKVGRITFTAELNLTSSATQTFLQNLGTYMEANSGSMKFDARTNDQMRLAGAEIKMYGINALGYTDVPPIIVKDDSGVIIPEGAANYPALSNISYAAGDGGTLIFTTDHFTQFDIGAAPSSPPSSPPPTPPKPLTAEEQVLLNLSIGQQADLYGKTTSGFTKMLYDNILGRVPDGEGLNNWATALDNGMTPGQVVFNLVFSEELKSKIASKSSTEFITFLYKNVLNRESDSEGYNGWVNAMKNGMSKEDVLLHFLDTDEFKNICMMFGLTP